MTSFIGFLTAVLKPQVWDYSRNFDRFKQVNMIGSDCGGEEQRLGHAVSGHRVSASTYSGIESWSKGANLLIKLASTNCG